MNERFYADEKDDDWFVFDSSVEPHKALSSWCCKQDAEDDANRRNEDCKTNLRVRGYDL